MPTIDIVDELRDPMTRGPGTCSRAAAEIERLREALKVARSYAETNNATAILRLIDVMLSQ